MLTVHKNTRDQRRAKDIRREFMSDAKSLKSMEGISGYSIVVWNKDCSAGCAWYSTPPVMPGLVVPEFTKKILERQIGQNDVNEIIDMRFMD